VAEVLPLSETELRLLESLLRHKIRFMVVGLSSPAVVLRSSPGAMLLAAAKSIAAVVRASFCSQND
jgi:hypothetical protein